MTNPESPDVPVQEGRRDGRRLLLRHRAGDRDAFPRLVAAYRSPVFAYLVRCGVAEPDRDDLFQDIFIQVHRAAPSFEGDRPLHPWLFTIVANTVRNYHRRRRVRDLVFGGPLEREPRASGADGEQASAARQTAAWLEAAIARLPLPQREVLLLACVERLPQREVARVLGMPVNTVKTHLRRARLSLARRLVRRNSLRAREVPS